VADFASQAIVCQALLAAFPGDPVVAEEDARFLRSQPGAALRDEVVRHVTAQTPGLAPSEALDAIDRGDHGGGARGRFWVLDPIDGTKGFLRNEQYAVALALVEEGQVVLGVVGCPNLPVDPARPDAGQGCVAIAARGRGTTVQALSAGPGPTIRVSDVADPAAATVTESVEPAHSAQDQAADIARRLGVARPPLRMDSQCKYVAVARGQADIYLRLPTRADYAEKIWDHAAGSLVVTEAGGRVTDLSGRTPDFSQGRLLSRNRGLIATNARLHERVLAAVRAVRPL